MSGQRHPDTEEIASLTAGPISGLRARRLAAHVAGCDRCAAVSEQLGAMRSMLASVPSPALPDAFERQISAAIATEVAARAADATPAGVGAARDQADRDAAEPGTRRSRRSHARSRDGRGFWLRPVMAIVPAVACLIVVFGYFASRPAPPAFSGSYSGVAGSAAEPSASASASSASGRIRTAGPEKEPPFASSFTVTASGTRYQASTLRAQVRGELHSRAFNTAIPSAASTAIPSPPPSAAPTALRSEAASSTGSGAATKQTLIGCVLTVTGGLHPSLVDKAYYDGEPAYVIAVPGKVWVVGLGCTASDTELITSVSLSGTP